MNKSSIYKYIDIIEQCPLFEGMHADEIIEIIEGQSSSDSCDIRQYPQGTVLPSDKMYVIITGSILIEKQASDGRWITMSIAGSPAAVNVAAVLEEVSDMSKLTMTSDGTVLELTRGMLQQTIAGGGTFALNIVRFLTGRITFLNHKITSLAGYSASGRLLMYIQEHAENGELVIPASMSDFADYLGVGRASLYRAFDGLESKGIIKRTGRLIRML